MRLRSVINSQISKLEKRFITHNRIEVSKSALLHNLDFFTKLNGLSVIPVLKSNAYGHGISLVAEALKGRKLPYIAVDGYFEALRIRAVSDQPVLIMGSILPDNYRHLKYDDFAFVVQDAVSIRALGETRKPIKVHLEVNTGMNRYGVSLDEIEELTRLIASYRNLELEGIMSHLADSDGDDPATVEAAVNLFDSCVDKVRATGVRPSVMHLAQSAGSITAESKYANTLRLGIGLYGINPFPKQHKLHDILRGLQPSLKLVSTITKVIELHKGDKVGYNYTFTAPEDTRIGIVPLGYYEGVSRQLSNTGAVLVNDTPVPIIGRVCMNHTMLNLKGIYAEVGDEVVVYSDNPKKLNAVDNIASKHGLFNYSILTSLSNDIRRILVD